MNADPTETSIVARIDSALTAWQSHDLASTLTAVEGVSDDQTEDKLFDRKDVNEFIEGGHQPHWIWWIDVSGEGQSSAMDALLIINHLTRGFHCEFESVTEDDFEFDINGDGIVTPSDALKIINALARAHMIQLDDEEENSEDPGSVHLQPVSELWVPESIDKVHKNESAVDREKRSTSLF